MLNFLPILMRHNSAVVIWVGLALFSAFHLFCILQLTDPLREFYSGKEKDFTLFLQRQKHYEL